MMNNIQSIALDKLVGHPDNPNRMSKSNFAKLVRNIKRSGRYEPLVVRPCPHRNCHSCENRNPDSISKKKGGCYQIINGHHRWQALRQLGYKRADAIVWDVDDQEADILLATLNRLEGSDVLEKKLALLARLNERFKTRDLAKLLPASAKQIERLVSLKGFTAPTQYGRFANRPYVANPVVFFLDDAQQEVVEKALSLARQGRSEKTKAAKKAAALTRIAQQFIKEKERIQNTGDGRQVGTGELNEGNRL